MARGPSSFAGRSAIVTGGASGIGRALGAELYGQGAHVVLADVDAKAAEETAAELMASVSSLGSIAAAVLDVRDREAVQRLVDQTAAERSGLDLLFNNAGISLGGPTEELPGSYWDRVIDVNLVGVVNGVLAAYPLMVARGRGHIVNTASAAGLLPAPFVVAYTATKHAVVGLSTALRPEAAAHGVRVSALCPGMVETPILDKGPPSDLGPAVSSGLSARAYLETGGLSPMSADLLASRALRGVARNQSIIVIPGSIKASWYLARLSPHIIDAFGRLTARKVRKAIGEARAATAPSRPR